MRLIHIHIPAWSKFNPRKDRANYTWFRFENDFFQDHKMFGLSDSQIILFQMLVCEASKKNKDSIDINLELIATYRRTTSAKITQDLQELIDRGVIVTANDRLNDGEQPANSLATRRNERTNETNVTNDAPADAGAVAEENPISIYCEQYKAKYGHNPAIGAKQAGILNRFKKNHPRTFRKLIEGYLSLPDSWAVQRSHPVELLESKLNEIVRFLETGKVVTKKVVQHAEEMIDKAQGTSKRPRKPIEELERERESMLAEANKKLLGGK